MQNIDDTDKPRTCSWCGKSEKEAPLVAAPNANICEACTRLACGIFGIEIVAEKPTRDDAKRGT